MIHRVCRTLAADLVGFSCSAEAFTFRGAKLKLKLELELKLCLILKISRLAIHVRRSSGFIRHIYRLLVLMMAVTVSMAMAVRV